MTKRSLTVLTLLIYGFLVVFWGLGRHPAKVLAADEKNQPGSPGLKQLADPLFTSAKVHEFHVEISAKDWEQMQPVGGMRFPGFGPGSPGNPPGAPTPEKPAAKPGEEFERHRSAFGMEFPWVHGEISAEGKTYKNVGIRYKGNATYMASARNLKRSLKIDLGHFTEDQRFHGLKMLNLHAGVMDETKSREALSYALFRNAGVAAPRTAFAQVTLTVPGKYDKEFLGLYILVEQVDKAFLKDCFKDGKGLLLKPERLRGIEYLGEDWSKYKSQYQPRNEPTKKEGRRLVEFTWLVAKADDDRFRKEIGSYLDVDAFLRYMAVNAMLVNLDSFFMLGHNYYIYLNPDSNKFVFIPWDLDLSLANFPMGGTPEQQMDLSLTHPFPGENKLIDRLFAMKEMSEKYQQILKEVSATCFTKERLLKDIATIEGATKDVIAKERKAVADRKEGVIGFGPPGSPFGRSTDLRTFVTKRTESVANQIAGKSKGFIPTMGFGFGGGGPGGPGGFGMGNPFARPLLEALDTEKDGLLSKEELLAGAKKFFKESDKDNQGALTEQAIAAGLNRIFPRPPGFGPPGGPGGGGPGAVPGGPGAGGPGPGPGGRPGGFGPGMFMAGPIVRRADADKDGKVTLAELLAATEALFKESDKEKKGTLSEKEIAAGLSILFPPPPGFGPPGGLAPGGKPAEPRKELQKEEKNP